VNEWSRAGDLVDGDRQIARGGPDLVRRTERVTGALHDEHRAAGVELAGAAAARPAGRHERKPQRDDADRAERFGDAASDAGAAALAAEHQRDAGDGRSRPAGHLGHHPVEDRRRIGHPPPGHPVGLLDQPDRDVARHQSVPSRDEHGSSRAAAG
jgi:hypothetical protein